jgi:hypothetical protein
VAREMGTGSGNTKKRAAASAVTDRRKVRTALADLNAKIGDWQSEAVYLEALAARDTNSDTSHVRDLRAKVEDGGARLEQAVGRLPEGLRTHGRVVDTQRALQQIADRLDRILTSEPERQPDGQHAEQTDHHGGPDPLPVHLHGRTPTA